MERLYQMSMHLNIMFYALMGRFHLEYVYFLLAFSLSSPSVVMFFFPVDLSSLSQHFQQALLAVEVSLPNVQTSSLSHDLNSNDQHPRLTTEEISKPNNLINRDLNSNCQLPKPGDRRNFSTQQDLLRMS